ncbi:hypothetical protein SMICM304S_09411 [Streptomyces microflavus]
MAEEGAKDEIWAYGLRNPWRFSFDAGTGDLLIGDVGQSEWEEINWAPASSKGGENYGWSSMEGNHPFRGGTEPANHVPPVHEYDRSGLGCSVTGGFVYRGEAIADLAGSYVYSDYCDGTLRTLNIENGEVTGEGDLGVQGGEVISFVEAGDGAVRVGDRRRGLADRPGVRGPGPPQLVLGPPGTFSLLGGPTPARPAFEDGTLAGVGPALGGPSGTRPSQGARPPPPRFRPRTPDGMNAARLPDGPGAEPRRADGPGIHPPPPQAPSTR